MPRWYGGGNSKLFGLDATLIERQIRHALVPDIAGHLKEFLSLESTLKRTGRRDKRNPRRSAMPAQPPQYQTGQLYSGVFYNKQTGTVGIRDKASKLKQLHYGYLRKDGKISGGTRFIYTFFDEIIRRYNRPDALGRKVSLRNPKANVDITLKGD